jgi:hypothetical protein
LSPITCDAHSSVRPDCGRRKKDKKRSVKWSEILGLWGWCEGDV